MPRKKPNTELNQLKKDLNRKGYFVRLPLVQEVKQELLLWRSVLDRALVDLIEVETQSEIISWLCNDYPDNEKENFGSFEDICALAHLPKDYVYKKFLEILMKVERSPNVRIFR